MVQRAALLALAAVLTAAGPAAGQDPPPADENVSPVAVLNVRSTGPSIGHMWLSGVELDSSSSYDPDGQIVAKRYLFNHTWIEQSTGNLTGTWLFLGTQQVALEVTDDQGATHLTSQDVHVWDPHSSFANTVPPPFFPPGGLRKVPTALFVPRYYRTAKLNRHGLPVRVECAWCTVQVELQLTRYRARRLGMRGPFPEPKITMAYAFTNFPPRAQHRFRLRPPARFRKALRRRRVVPILLKMRTSNFVGRSVRTTAEIELRR